LFEEQWVADPPKFFAHFAKYGYFKELVENGDLDEAGEVDAD
jgi:hypothetical protein